MKKRLIGGIFAALCVLSAFAFWFFAEETPRYLTQKVGRADITQSIEAVGRVYAKEQVDVGAQVSGQITKLFVRLGDRVREGDLIAQIDKDKQQNDLDITKARLESARANLQSKKIALELTSRQYLREQKLYAKKATSLENLEKFKENFYNLKANVAALRAEVVELEITLKNAQKDLGYTTIRAPMSGVVINVAVDEGQTVNANQNTPTIARIANLEQMEVRMELAEADVAKVRVGSRLHFALLSHPEKKYPATIASLDPADTQISDLGSGQSGGNSANSKAIYYYAKFFVENEKQFLRIGMSLQNEILIASLKDALIVPTYAIKSDAGGDFVEILEGGRPAKKYVKLGIKDAINTAILEGLSGGEDLIVSSSASSL